MNLKKKCPGLSQTLYSNLRYFILQLQQHISKSKCRAIAIELEKSKEDCDVELIDITQDKSRQTKIDTLALSSSREAYIWILITAYEIAYLKSDLFCNTLFYGNAIKSVISTLLWTGIGECVISVTARNYLYLFWLILLDFFYGMLTIWNGRCINL